MAGPALTAGAVETRAEATAEAEAEAEGTDAAAGLTAAAGWVLSVLLAAGAVPRALPEEDAAVPQAAVSKTAAHTVAPIAARIGPSLGLGLATRLMIGQKHRG
jgi:hypothetical protein